MRFAQFVSPALALLVGSVAAHDSCPAPSVVSSATPSSTPVVIDVDLVVIGGGSSGIHAAIQLKDAGAKVVVIEKKKQIGGHAETFFTPSGSPINTGVVIFENSTTVHSYFSRLGVPTTLVVPSELPPGTPATTNYDFSLGVPIPAQNASATQAQNDARTAAAQSYSTNILAKYTWLDAGLTQVPDPVPAELLLPFGDLAKKYSFEALLPLIAQYNWFSGDVSTIPALYGVKALGPGLFNSLFGKFVSSATGDTRSLYDSAAKELGDSILLNSTIVKVRRTVKNGKAATGVTVSITQPGQPPKLIRAKKLLVAIPQTLKNIGTFDISGDERDVFSKFSSLGYWSGVVAIPNLSNSINNVGVSTPYNQPVIPGTNGFNQGAAGYFTTGIGFNDLNYTEATGYELLRTNLATLAAVGGLSSASASAATFPFFSDHRPYNVRVSTNQIRKGFYNKLSGLQGKRNTYWTGAAFTGHNSGLIWNFNLGTVVPGLKKDLGL